MHHCLEVPEILDLILRHVPPEPVAQNACRHLVSCTLTCRVFSDVALDIIWHTQTSLVPLLKRLPPVRWSEKPSYGFNRVFDIERPRVQEIQRLKFYTRRIRKIQYLPYMWHLGNTTVPYDLQSLRKLRNATTDKSEPLFPNLLQLEFIKPQHAIPCLDIFLESKSISLSLHWSEADQRIEGLFPIIKRHALHMQELDLGSFKDEGGQITASASPIFSQLVCKMRDLRGLACGPRMLSSSALGHLMNLLRLSRLQFPNTSQDILNAAKSSRNIFPSLQHLVMREENLSSSATMLKHMRPLQLQTLAIHCSKIPRPADLHVALSALETESEQAGAVQKITLKYISPHEDRNNRVIVMHPVISATNGVIDGTILEPLLSFRNLTTLSLDIPCAMEIGDVDLTAMADAWPRLRYLQLGSMRGWGMDSLVTFNGLLYLLKRCRELEHLAMPFDTTHDPPPNIEISPEHINNNITYLFVGDASLCRDAIKSVARFLKHVFPKLSGIGGYWLYGNHSFEASKHSDEWNEVVKNIRLDGS